MRVTEREPGDRQRLDERIRAEKRAKQRDRLRMVAMALDGLEKKQIAALLGVVKSTVEHWVYRYRDHGLDAVKAKKQPGKPPLLNAEQKAELKARVLAGPRPEDGVTAFRGKDVQRLIRTMFGVRLSLTQTYTIMHGLGLAWLAPRPRHENQDIEAQQRFRDATPFFSAD